jgi:Asp-tRNA(Asn)/Glu-tRNA(Gln) amidotransferase A subunit family amidase
VSAACLRGDSLSIMYLIQYPDTSNNNTVHGMPPNPHSAHHYPGGSSGGSASAVSLGLVPLALGADGGGSIRIPSSYCAITGLKPSHGRISVSPTPGLAPSVGVVGPMATNVTDIAIGYTTMATPDPRSRSSAYFPSPLTGNPSSKKTIGIYDPWFARAEASVLKLCRRALDKYQAAGWSVVPITIPLLPLGQTAHAMTILSEISVSASSTPTASGTGTLPTFSAANRILLSVARQTPANDFLLAQKLRNLLMQHLSFLFQENPEMIIVTPTAPNAGWQIENGEAELKGGVSDADKSVRSMEYIWLANFTGCPAISIPIGFTKKEDSEGKEGTGAVNFPVGLMGMGEWGNETGLLDWAQEAEKFLKAEGEGDWRPKGEWVDVFKLAEERKL